MAKKKNASKEKTENAPSPEEQKAAFEKLMEPAALRLDLARELADDWIIEASHCLHDNVLDIWTVREVARSAVADLRSCLDLCFIAHDQGDQAETCEFRKEEASLPPRAVDSWARGCVPTKPKPRKQWIALSDAAGAAGGNKLPSEAGRSVARSTRSRNTRGVSRRVISSAVPRFGGNANKDDAVQRCIVYLEDGDEVGALRGGMNAGGRKGRHDKSTRRGSGGDKKLGSMDSNSSGFSDGRDHLSSAEEVRMMALRKLEMREKAEEERRQALQQRAKEEEERNQKLARELKGKEYTFDHEGGIIMMHPVQADKLPPTHYNVGMALRPVSVQDGTPPPESRRGDTGMPRPQAQAQAQTQSPDDNKSAKAAKKNSTTSSPASESAAAAAAAAASSTATAAATTSTATTTQMSKERHYKATVSFQQRISKNSALNVQPGVVLREAGETVAGPPRPESSNHMSRKNFTAHQSSLESESLEAAAAAASASASAAKSNGVGSAGQASSSGTVGQSMTATSSLASAPSVGHGTGGGGDTALPRDSSNATASTTTAAAGTGADQADVMSVAATPKANSSAGGMDSGGQTDVPLNDHNLALIHDPNWGQNIGESDFTPAQLPSALRLNVKQAPTNKAPTVVYADGSTDGDSSVNQSADVHKRRPRERPHVETKTSKERKFLPAPVYPANTGIGMSSINGVATNPNSPANGNPSGSGTTIPASPQSTAAGGAGGGGGGSVVNYQQKSFQRKPSDRVNVASDRADRWLGVPTSSGPGPAA